MTLLDAGAQHLLVSLYIIVLSLFDMIFIYKIILFEHILISINCELYFFGSILGCKPHVSKWFHFLAIQALDRLI